MHEKRWDEAKGYFVKAQAAPPRPNRQVADAGRQREIQQALLEVAKHL